MTTRLAGGIAAVAFAFGILSGVAGTIVARDASTTTNPSAVMAGHMDGQDMTGMMSMMGGPMMGGPMMGGSMMGGSMMGGPNAPMGPQTMGPEASAMPGPYHDQHHPAATLEASE